MSLASRFSELVSRMPGGRAGAALALAVLAGLGVGFTLVPRVPAPDEAKLEPPRIDLLGQPLALDESATKTALERVRRYLARRFVLELGDGKRREIYLGQLGAELDKLHLTDLVRDARDVTSPLSRTFRSENAGGRLALPLPVRLDREVAVAYLGRLKDELDRAPVDARMDLEKRTLLTEIKGRYLDVDATLLAIERALASGRTSAALAFEERKPRRSEKELGEVKFDSVLGWFETRYDRSMKYEARSFNLRIAASKLDGHVLLPGEIFDFNAVVGARDEANGYKVAKVIAEGELVDGIGGGTCQISGTLHGAAFFAGLEITERYPHTRPSSYIKLGLDATVVYPTINMRLKNVFPFPVVLHQTVKNGIVRAEILGPSRDRTVTLVRRITDSIPYEEVERPDKLLPAGKRVLGQRGVAGFKVRRYRIVRAGPHAVRERWDDVYPPTTQIVRIGTGSASDDEKLLGDDPHPEYLADELLVVTQGPDTSDESDDDGEPSDGVMWESREPGRFGKSGWTEEAGMPFWKSRESQKSGEEEGETPGKKRGKV
jgi:vancomycin resistance protein YoaR